MTRLPIGQPARVIGMDSASMIVGCVWRNGGIVYALREAKLQIVPGGFVSPPAVQLSLL